MTHDRWYPRKQRFRLSKPRHGIPRISIRKAWFDYRASDARRGNSSTSLDKPPPRLLPTVTFVVCRQKPGFTTIRQRNIFQNRIDRWVGTGAMGERGKVEQDEVELTSESSGTRKFSLPCYSNANEKLFNHISSVFFHTFVTICVYHVLQTTIVLSRLNKSLLDFV